MRKERRGYRAALGVTRTGVEAMTFEERQKLLSQMTCRELAREYTKLVNLSLVDEEWTEMVLNEGSRRFGHTFALACHMPPEIAENLIRGVDAEAALG
jgi:hypothetical protein